MGADLDQMLAQYLDIHSNDKQEQEEYEEEEKEEAEAKQKKERLVANMLRSFILKGKKHVRMERRSSHSAGRLKGFNLKLIASSGCT